MKPIEPDFDLSSAKTRRNSDFLTGTFIMPTGAARPSIIREPGLRWQLEMHRLKARFQNLREY